MHLTLFASLLAIIVLNAENQFFFNPTKEGRERVLKPNETPYDEDQFNTEQDDRDKMTFLLLFSHLISLVFHMKSD